MGMSKKSGKTVEELLQDALVPEEEQPYPVPENWVWVRLGKVVDVNPPKIKLADAKDDDMCSFIPMAAISDREGIIFDKEERTYGQVKSGYTQFIDGDVLFAKITPCMENGKSAIAKDLINGIGYGSTEFYILRSKEMFETRLLYQLVRSSAFRSEAKRHMTGAVGQQRVPKKFLEDYPIPLPPIKEQKRIADKLDRLLDKINRAKQLIEEAKETFELRRAAILDKAFRGELTKKWREEKGIHFWGVEKLESILQNDKGIFDGPFGSNLKSDDYTDHGIRVIRLENIGVLEFIDSKYSYISQEKFDNLSKHSIFEGDIMFSSFISENIRVCLVPNLDTKAINKADCFCIRPNTKLVNKDFLLYYLSSIHCYHALINMVHGATRPRVNLTQLKSIEIPLPTLEEQEEIVHTIKNLLRKLTDSNDLLKNENVVENLKYTILTKAFKGQLGTSDLTEESAVNLLKEKRE